VRLCSRGVVRVEVLEKRGSNELGSLCGLNDGGDKLVELFLTTIEGLWLLLVL
jgi:hypothetical protein